MILLQKLALSAEACFASHGYDTDQYLLTMRTDMGCDGVYKDVFIILTAERLAVLEGFICFSGKARASERTEGFRETRFDEYDLSELEDLSVELFISSGRLTARYEGEDAEIAAFSNTYKHNMNVLVKAVNELKNKGSLDEAEFKHETEDEHFCPKCGQRYPDMNRKICPKCMEKAKLVKRLAGMFIKYRLYILMIFLTFALTTALGVLTPYVSNTVFYDDVLTKGGRMYGEIGKMILLIVGVKFISLIVSMINGIISAKVAAEVVFDLKKTIFDTLSGLSMKFFTNRQTGGLMTQINSDAQRIYWFFCDGFPYLVTSVLQLVIVVIVMIIMNPLLTVLTFLTVPVFFIVSKLLFVFFSKLHARAYSKQRSFNSLISDVLNGMRVVKSFSRESVEIGRFSKRNTEQAEAQQIINVSANRYFSLLSFFMKLGSYVVWGVGGYFVITKTGGMTYGTFMAFVAYVTLVYGPLDFISDVSNWWSECLNALQRLFEIKDTQPDVVEKDGAIELKSIKGDVEFKNVSFSYEENRVVIDDISFSIKAGTTLGIVGHTGAGKSTIANLLNRLYDPVSGDIYIDGYNIKELSFSTMRRAIGIVSQETYLFRGTIYDNIKYAAPEASYEDVITAAKIASAHDFIIKYPDGYQTMIGFGHKELSGGERQRISIARAILKNPDILVLDEATAAMDTQTERQIQEALTRLTKNRTTLIIAHRLSTLRDADNLIVIEDGKIPESGTAEALLKKKGVYYKLYKLQAEALKTIGVED